MAICRIIETSATPAEYERVREALNIGDQPPEGASLHVAADGDDGKIRIVEVWESRDEAESFGDRVRAARESLGIGQARQPVVTYLDVHSDWRR